MAASGGLQQTRPAMRRRWCPQSIPLTCVCGTETTAAARQGGAGSWRAWITPVLMHLETARTGLEIVRPAAVVACFSWRMPMFTGMMVMMFHGVWSFVGNRRRNAVGERATLLCGM